MLDDETVVRVLTQHKLLSPFMLTQARRIQKRSKTSIYEVILTNKLVDEPAVLGLLSPYCDTPCVALGDFVGEPDLLAAVTRDVAAKHRALPLGTMEEDGQTWMVLAMVDPTDLAGMEAFNHLLGESVKPVLVGPNDLAQALDRCYGPVKKKGASSGSNRGPAPDMKYMDAGFARRQSEIIPWEDELDSQADRYLDGILDDSDVVLLSEHDELYEGTEADRQDDSDFATIYSKPTQDNDSLEHAQSNVFRDFIRKSSVLMIPPPALVLSLPERLERMAPARAMAAILDLLVGAGLLSQDEVNEALIAVENEEASQ